jgi:hypothetical protein
VEGIRNCSLLRNTEPLNKLRTVVLYVSLCGFLAVLASRQLHCPP